MTLSIQVDSTDLARVKGRFSGAAARTPFAVISALEEAGRDLKELSFPLVPYDPDREEPGEHLRDTAFMGIFEDATGPYVRMGYDKVYAWRQHEEIGWEHPHGGQAKYLESPAAANKGRYAQMVKDATRRALNGGI